MKIYIRYVDSKASLFGECNFFHVSIKSNILTSVLKKDCLKKLGLFHSVLESAQAWWQLSKLGNILALSNPEPKIMGHFIIYVVPIWMIFDLLSPLSESSIHWPLTDWIH